MATYSKPTLGLPPFQQGGLDSLCGLYSIINAERFINHSSDWETQQLFDDLIHFLARRKLLSKLLIGGIIHTEMLLILDKVVGKQRISNVRIPWRGVHNPDLTAFWKSMQRFLDGTPGRAIVVRQHGQKARVHTVGRYRQHHRPGERHQEAMHDPGAEREQPQACDDLRRGIGSIRKVYWQHFRLYPDLRGSFPPLPNPLPQGERVNNTIAGIRHTQLTTARYVGS